MTREVPYYTTNASSYLGHIWRAVDGGADGFCYEVLRPHGRSEIAYGWRPTQVAAEQAMNEVLAKYEGK